MKHVTIVSSTPTLTIDKHMFKWRDIIFKDPPRTHKVMHGIKNTQRTYDVTQRHLRIIILEKKSIRQYVFGVCVGTLNYSVLNNRAKCYIAKFHIFRFSKLYTFSYHMYQFQKMILNINYVFLFILRTLSIKFRILKLIQADFIINVYRSLSKVHVIFSHFNNCWIFSTDLRKLLQIYLIEDHPVTKELFHADTRTAGRIDWPNDANSSFPKFLVWFHRNINFVERF
jgi:hypothetical protein